MKDHSEFGKALQIGSLMLGVDTCGAIGSIALGRVEALEGVAKISLLGEAAIAGGEYAAMLVTSIADMLDELGATVAELAGIVVVAGPGSFTGIRIGLATVKALAEAASLPVIAVSRLAVLAAVAQTAAGAKAPSVVLDAHRGQFFCCLYSEQEPSREMLLTAGEINSMGGLPLPVAVCEEEVAQTIEMLLEVEPLRVAAPTASNALQVGLASWLAGDFADVATLDGYYLRGADAKIASR